MTLTAVIIKNRCHHQRFDIGFLYLIVLSLFSIQISVLLTIQMDQCWFFIPLHLKVEHSIYNDYLPLICICNVIITTTMFCAFSLNWQNYHGDLIISEATPRQESWQISKCISSQILVFETSSYSQCCNLTLDHFLMIFSRSESLVWAGFYRWMTVHRNIILSLYFDNIVYHKVDFKPRPTFCWIRLAPSMMTNDDYFITSLKTIKHTFNVLFWRPLHANGL